MATPSEQSVIDDLTALVTGLKKHAPGRPFVLASQTYSAADILGEVNALLAAASAVPKARGALKDAIRADRELRARKAELLRGLRGTIQSMFRGQTTTLADFGLEPPRARRPATTEEAVLAVEKRRATRKERRTMGKKQKAAIKGDVTGVVITPKVK